MGSAQIRGGGGGDLSAPVMVGAAGGPARRDARPVAHPQRPARFRRVARFALAALALGGALLLPAPAPAEAQTATVLVKNTGQSVSSSGHVLNSSFNRRAQAFTTGTAAGGYALSSIGVSFGTIGSTSTAGADLTVTLNVNSSGDPGGALCTLSDPASFTSGAVNTFDVPATCPGLAASTTYFVVVERVVFNASNDINLSNTSSGNEDTGGAAGWSIGNNRHYREGTVWRSFSSPYLIEVKGFAIVPPARVTGFDLDGDNDNPKGIWGNDETIWVSQSGTTGKLFAYNRSDGSRNSGEDFNTLSAAGNDAPTGLCSDGTTMFVVDWADNKVYAYDLVSKARDSTKDITLAAANTKSEGLWCNADTVWVAEDDFTGSNDIFAYNRADGTANTDVDFPALDPTVDGSPLNANPRGIWSDGTTMFVVDDEDATVYAWKMADQTRDSDKEIALDADNADPEGLWFDGRVLWVIDDADDRLYAYDLQGAQPDNTIASGAPAVRTPTSEDVWTATLTAASHSLIDGVGYITNPSPAVGSLSPGTFTVDEVTYTITALYDGDSDANEGILYLALDKEVSRDFTISVGGASFFSASAIHNAVATGEVYLWSGANLSWTATDTISVVLSVDAVPEQGVEVRADVSGIRDPTDGLENAFFHYQWIRVDAMDEIDLAGETGSTYTPTADDVDKHLKVRVIFDDDAGNRERPRTSRQVGPVVGNSAATGAPTIDGTAQAGELLSAGTADVVDANGLTNVAYSYQWLRRDGTNDIEIPGAVGPQYIPSDADVGKTLKVRVDFSDDAGFAEQLTSAATTSSVTAAASGSVVWSATLKVGSLVGIGQVIGYQLTPPTPFTHDGALTPNGFMRNGVSYTFHELRRGDTPEDPATVLVGPNLTRDDMESWTLIFADDEFRLSDSLRIGPVDRPGVQEHDAYYLHRTGLSWSDGDYVAVALNIGSVVSNPRLDLVFDNVSEGGRSLTVKPHSTNTSDFGYGPDHGYTGSSLSGSTRFFSGQTHEGTPYQYEYEIVAVRSDGSLVLRLEVNTAQSEVVTIPVPATSHLKLAVDGDEFDLGDATLTQTTDSDNNTNLEFVWASSGLTWVEDQEVVVFVLADDPDVTVGFEYGDYSVAEGDSVTVKVKLSKDPKREVVVPLVVTNLDGASNSDYSFVPASVTFQSGETEQSFTLSATDDTDDDDGERVRLSFGTLPAGVTAGTTDAATVSITDNNDPAVSVSFEHGSYAVAEGASVTVRVRLSVAPERTVVVPLTVTYQGGASTSDHSGVPASVTFQSVETEKSFTFTATQDSDDDDGERVRLGFGTLPARVTAGTTGVATMSITDDDDPAGTNNPGAPTVSVRADRSTITPGTTVRLYGIAGDPDGDDNDLSYAWTSDGGGTFSKPRLPDTRWSAPATAVGTVNLTLTVTDADGLRASDTVSVEVVAALDGADAPGVRVTPTQLTVAEGATATYTVALVRQPTANVRVSLQPQRVGITGRSVLLNTYSLEFTPTSWNTPQRVTIDAIPDGDGNDDVVPIRHKVTTGSAPEYRGLNVDTLSVTVTDPDAAPKAVLTMSTRDQDVAEGGSVTITVNIDRAPDYSGGANVRVGLDYAQGLVTGTGHNNPVQVRPPWGTGGTPWATESTYVDLVFAGADTSKSFTISVRDDSVRSPEGSRRIIVGIIGSITDGVVKGAHTVVYIHVPEND